MNQHPSFTVADRIIDLIKQHDIMTAFWDELDILQQTMLAADIATLVEQYNPTIALPSPGQRIIDTLTQRGGFDHWWYSLHSDDKDDILTDLDQCVVWGKLGGDLNTYQQIAHSTSKNARVGDDLVVYPVLGLCGEAGEVADKIKKIHRDKGGIISPDDLQEIKLELGDCIYYIAEIAYQLGLSLAEVAAANNKKLADRNKRGVIGGNGDNR